MVWFFYFFLFSWVFFSPLTLRTIDGNIYFRWTWWSSDNKNQWTFLLSKWRLLVDSKSKSGIKDHCAMPTFKKSFMPQQLNIKIFNGKVFILGSKIIRCNKGVKILARTTKKTRDQILIISRLPCSSQYIDLALFK